jgi:hypothetical protein
MMDGKSLSEAIRKRKKHEGAADLRPDMDYAGQDAVDPNTAWDEQQNMEVSNALDMPDHEPATPKEMGEDESSQDVAELKKSLARISKYFESL